MITISRACGRVKAAGSLRYVFRVKLAILPWPVREESRPSMRQIERELEADMTCTRREFERASMEFHRQLSAVDEIPPQDAIVALENASKHRQYAYERYLEALGRFTDFAARGIIPTWDREPAQERDRDRESDPKSNKASG